jgi:hypothetical protein
MDRRPRTFLTVFVAAMSGLFSLPWLIFGSYLFVCWARIHTSNVYYVDYSYATSALVWIGVGLLSLLMTLYGAWRRSFYGVLFAVPIFLGLAAMVAIPDARPEVFGSMVADSNYLQHVGSFLHVWYEDHHRFPVNEPEFREAMEKGPVAFQYGFPPTLTSPYKQRGNVVPYEVVVVPGANGPRVTDVSSRPGVIYYCVSGELQEFWVTMTGLHSDVAQTASIKHVADRPEEKYSVVHAAGCDYPVKKH